MPHVSLILDTSGTSFSALLICLYIIGFFLCSWCVSVRCVRAGPLYRQKQVAFARTPTHELSAAQRTGGVLHVSVYAATAAAATTVADHSKGGRKAECGAAPGEICQEEGADSPEEGDKIRRHVQLIR